MAKTLSTEDVQAITTAMVPVIKKTVQPMIDSAVEELASATNAAFEKQDKRYDKRFTKIENELSEMKVELAKKADKADLAKKADKSDLDALATKHDVTDAVSDAKDEILQHVAKQYVRA